MSSGSEARASSITPPSSASEGSGLGGPRVGVGRVEAENFREVLGADEMAGGTELEAAEEEQETELIQALSILY